ncbi:hypothetical protein JOS77_29185 [Chromobacterium haemolyticum]|nr:hypothetical protein JOS77_29185 [Chromobacterium haemolyticum]
MSRQWIRACKLIVGLQSGSDEALDLSAFRIRFVVRQQMTSTPQSAEIYVYNLSNETAARFIGEGQEVTLQAGYQDSAMSFSKAPSGRSGVGENRRRTLMCASWPNQEIKLTPTPS